jgi:spoIIIJ-associated protein
MIKNFEASGKTVEEAIDNALALANAAIEDVDIEVLELGGRGVFGLGKKDARVRVSLETPDEITTPAREKSRPQQPEKPQPAQQQPEKAAAPALADEAPQVTEMIRQRPTEEAAPKGRRRGAKDTAAASPAAAAVAASKSKDSPPAQLSKAEAEALAKKARAFLDPLFASLKVQPQHEIKIKEGLVWLVFSGAGLGSLIGRRGEMLNALQYLTNLAVNRDRKEHARLVLDVEGYRAGREETLVALAKKMAEKAVRSGRRVELEPMNPHERRIVHMALQNDKRVDTLSQGEEPYRRVVISRHRQDSGAKSGHGKEYPPKRGANQQRAENKGPSKEHLSLTQQLSRQFSEQIEDR